MNIPMKTGLLCEQCDTELESLEDKVYCPNGKCPATHEGKFRQVKPR